MIKVLKMSAGWCNPCTLMDTQLERLKDKLGDIEIIPVDIEVSSELAKQYSIRSIPTLIKLDELGTESERSVGSLTDEKLLGFLL